MAGRSPWCPSPWPTGRSARSSSRSIRAGSGTWVRFSRWRLCMRLFVLGATGRTGVELVDLALAEGHEVTAFVRSPHKIVRRDQRLDVVKGDPRSVSALVEALPGHDAVLSALGPAPREAMTVSTLLRESAASTVQAMKTAGVPRLAVVSSALLFLGGGPLVALERRVLRPHLEDMRAME